MKVDVRIKNENWKRDLQEAAMNTINKVSSSRVDGHKVFRERGGCERYLEFREHCFLR